MMANYKKDRAKIVARDQQAQTSDDALNVNSNTQSRIQRGVEKFFTQSAASLCEVESYAVSVLSQVLADAGCNPTCVEKISDIDSSPDAHGAYAEVETCDGTVYYHFAVDRQTQNVYLSKDSDCIDFGVTPIFTVTGSSLLQAMNGRWFK